MGVLIYRRSGQEHKALFPQQLELVFMKPVDVDFTFIQMHQHCGKLVCLYPVSYAIVYPSVASRQSVRGQFVGQKFILGSSMRCDQVYKCQRYDFGHTLLLCSSQTQMTNKSTSGKFSADKMLQYATFESLPWLGSEPWPFCLFPLTLRLSHRVDYSFSDFNFFQNLLIPFPFSQNQGPIL